MGPDSWYLEAILQHRFSQGAGGYAGLVLAGGLIAAVACVPEPSCAELRTCPVAGDPIDAGAGGVGIGFLPPFGGTIGAGGFNGGSAQEAGAAGEAGEAGGTDGAPPTGAPPIGSGQAQDSGGAGPNSGGAPPNSGGARPNSAGAGPENEGEGGSDGGAAGFGGFSGVPAAGASGEGEAGGASEPGTSGSCGDGMQDPAEECDDGPGNEKSAYGPEKCTDQCMNAPYCGDGIRNGPEVCDNKGSGATELGSCNPECTGFYEKKRIRITAMHYTTNLGGISGADAKCQTQFGTGWKALLVGGSRRATVTPYAGDKQQDWVIQKYTYYYTFDDKLVWRTDNVSLLGVRNGMRLNLYADIFEDAGTYPWAGWGADWTTLDGTEYRGTCNGWTTDSSSDGWGSFVTKDLATAASEPCGASGFLLCVEQ